MSIEDTDVVVVGAGTAGIHVAWRLAQNGHRVVLIEKKQRDELGHDWWDGVTRKVFPEASLPLPAPPERMNDAGPSKIYAPGNLPPVDAQPNPDVLIVDRKLLIRRQVALAEDAGVDFRFGACAREPLLRGGEVAGVVVSTDDGKTHEIRSRLTIDASGIKGVLRGKISRRYGFIGRVAGDDTMYCYREIRTRPPGNTETGYIFGDRHICWFNREQDGLVDFFAGVIGAQPGPGPGPKKLVAEMVRNDPTCGEVVRGGHGGLIPLRHCLDSFVAPGFMLVGDAACQCNPINGSGIASSLRSAGIAARVAGEALENGDTSVPALWEYNAEYKRNFGCEFAFIHALQKFVVNEPGQNIALLFRHGIVSLDQLRGPVDTRGLIGPEQIAGLLRLARRPAFLVRLLTAVTTAKGLEEHFRNYPAKYSEAAFKRWKRKKERLFRRIERWPAFHNKA